MRFVNGDGAALTAEAEPETQARVQAERTFFAEWIVTAILLIFCSTALVQAFEIPTGSMERTLLTGDHLLVDKLAYAPGGAVSRYVLPYREIHRGDIIVFRYPMDISQTFVKRCIGVPGDRIKLVEKTLWLNGQPVDEPYVFHNTASIQAYRDNFPNFAGVAVLDKAHDMLAHHVVKGEVVVPPGQYLALGDNREDSLDSRYWGFVPRENIIGKPLLIYWSHEWKRMFHLIHGYSLQ